MLLSAQTLPPPTAWTTLPTLGCGPLISSEVGLSSSPMASGGCWTLRRSHMQHFLFEAQPQKGKVGTGSPLPISPVSLTQTRQRLFLKFTSFWSSTLLYTHYGTFFPNSGTLAGELFKTLTCYIEHLGYTYYPLWPALTLTSGKVKWKFFIRQSQMEIFSSTFCVCVVVLVLGL